MNEGVGPMSFEEVMERVVEGIEIAGLGRRDLPGPTRRRRERAS